MIFLSTNGKGLALCLAIAVPVWLLGQAFPLIGGPIIAILLGMLITIPIKDKTNLAPASSLPPRRSSSGRSSSWASA